MADSFAMMKSCLQGGIGFLLFGLLPLQVTAQTDESVPVVESTNAVERVDEAWAATLDDASVAPPDA